MSTAPALSLNPTLSERFGSLDQSQRLRMGLGIALLVAIGVIGMMMGRQAEWLCSSRLAFVTFLCSSRLI